MDFDEEDKHMRLHSLHPGVTEEQVRTQTGFTLKTPRQIPTTPAPTQEELHILRARVDPEGRLRKTARREDNN
jgi:glutaconate CoA-transferase subunit B